MNFETKSAFVISPSLNSPRNIKKKQSIKLQKPNLFKENSSIIQEIENFQQSPQLRHKTGQKSALKSYLYQKKQTIQTSPSNASRLEINTLRKDSLIISKNGSSIFSQSNQKMKDPKFNPNRDPTFFIEESKKLLKKVNFFNQKYNLFNFRAAIGKLILF